MNKEPKNISKKTWTTKILFVFACLITLVALFYAEEDLRGKYEWDKCKAGLEAKGEKINFDDFIPAPVPDDQNFAMSPVWIARIKYNFLLSDKAVNGSQMAEAWYGDRVNDDDVAKFSDLMPLSASALTGTNWSLQKSTPDFPVRWTSGRTFDLRPWQSYYRNLEETNPAAQINITPQPQTPAADVLLALSKFDPAIEQLRQDSQRPYSRFPVQYDTDDTADILLPHLFAVKQCAQVLELRALAELQAGQKDKACDDVKLMLRLNDSIQTEPFIITHLVRMAIIQMTIQCIYEGLSEHQWSDAQLADLDSELSKINYPANYQFSILSESAGHAKILKWIEQKRSHGGEYLGLLNSYNGLPKSTARLIGIAFYLAPEGWFYQSDILFSERDRAWSSVAAGDTQLTISPEGVRQAKNTVKVVLGHGSRFNVIGQLLFSADFSSYAQRTAFAQASVDLTRTAIALERYFLANGEFPASLDVLAPKYIQEIPADIINGEPLHYRLTSDGQFVLYSVGWNERDDGGIPFAGSTDRGDWVWRYPTK